MRQAATGAATMNGTTGRCEDVPRSDVRMSNHAATTVRQGAGVIDVNRGAVPHSSAEQPVAGAFVCALLADTPSVE
jgi:hypothetical protein